MTVQIENYKMFNKIEPWKAMAVAAAAGAGVMAAMIGALTFMFNYVLHH